MRNTGIRYARPVPVQPVAVQVPQYDSMFEYRVVGTGAKVPIHDRNIDGRIMRGNDSIIGYDFKNTGRDDCGETKYWRVCVDDASHSFRVPYTCHSAYCTVCYKYWITQAAERIAEKLIALYRPIDIEGGMSALKSDTAKHDSYKRLQTIRRYPFRHWVLSFPSSYRPDKGDVFEIMGLFKGFGLMGCSVYHPYRLTAYGAGLCKRYRDEDAKNAELCKCRKKYHGNWDVWHQEKLYEQTSTYYLSPHLHLVMAGFVPKELENILVSRGFVLKMVRVVGKPSVESIWKIESLLKYLLSHSAYMGRSGAYRYLSLGNFVRSCKKKVPVEPQLITCPVCGAPMRNEGGTMDGSISMNYIISKDIYYLKVMKSRKTETLCASPAKFARARAELTRLMQRVAEYEKPFEGGIFAY